MWQRSRRRPRVGPRPVQRSAICLPGL
jgi:hypothetical protein